MVKHATDIRNLIAFADEKRLKTKQDAYAVLREDKENAMFVLEINPAHPLTNVRKPKLNKSEVTISAYKLSRPAEKLFRVKFISPLYLNDVGK